MKTSILVCFANDSVSSKMTSIQRKIYKMQKNETKATYNEGLSGQVKSWQVSINAHSLHA